MLYPNHYAWFILASTLDILVTHTILHYFGGWEVNAVAQGLIERFGVWGLVGLKYSSVIFVILVCEIQGKRNRARGAMLATAAVVIAAMPVGIGLMQIWAWTR